MSPLEKELARQRAGLRRIEDAHTRQVTRAYSAVNARLRQNLAALTRQIEQAQAAGVEVRPGWIYAQARYRQLISDLVEHTDAFLASAARIITAGQDAAVHAAVEDGRRLARAALGPAPKSVLVQVATSWDRLAAPALDYLIGRASDRGPLGSLLNEIAPLAREKVEHTLLYGVAAGKNPRAMAREVQAAAQITRTRALVIARTEIVGAHREAAAPVWRQTGVVQKWTWSCAKDRRTCAACWAMDGTEHDLGEPMGSHPQCRCAKVPKTLSWEELGFRGIPDSRPQLVTGPDAFERLPEADQLAILGRARLDAYNAGDITLADLVQHTHSPRWGYGIRVKPARSIAA
jgi:SPP1 gp7 family putative phage head morphogenesis protein